MHIIILGHFLSQAYTKGVDQLFKTNARSSNILVVFQDMQILKQYQFGSQIDGIFCPYRTWSSHPSGSGLSVPKHWSTASLWNSARGFAWGCLPNRKHRSLCKELCLASSSARTPIGLPWGMFHGWIWMVYGMPSMHIYLYVVNKYISLCLSPFLQAKFASYWFSSLYLGSRGWSGPQKWGMTIRP